MTFHRMNCDQVLFFLSIHFFSTDWHTIFYWSWYHQHLLCTVLNYCCRFASKFTHISLQWHVLRLFPFALVRLVLIKNRNAFLIDRSETTFLAVALSTHARASARASAHIHTHRRQGQLPSDAYLVHDRQFRLLATILQWEEKNSKIGLVIQSANSHWWAMQPFQ